MTGFVCVDPRLSKRNAEGGSYNVKNEKWTTGALTGHIHEGVFGTPPPELTAGLIADTMPIVISRARIDYLAREGYIQQPT